jgi:hypothetical protein
MSYGRQEAIDDLLRLGLGHALAKELACEFFDARNWPHSDIIIYDRQLNRVVERTPKKWVCTRVARWVDGDWLEDIEP